MDEILREFLYIVSHFEDYISIAIHRFGAYTYILLFFVIFLEAASIITSFLPGDSLIFVTGTLASIKLINIIIIFIVLCAAVIAGDIVNYYVGKILGRKILRSKDNKVFKKESIERAHMFYENYGRVAIIMGRFIPIVRSFIAFVAGITSMNLYKFMGYAIIGGILRIFVFLFAGYYFGTLKIVRDNLEFAIVIVATITIIPAIVGFIKGRIKPKTKSK
jgi:membrane-associated protein